MAIFQVPSPLATIVAASTYNAQWFSGATDAAKINAAIVAAAADGAKFVFIPGNMVYSSGSLVLNAAVKLLYEGQSGIEALAWYSVKDYGAVGDGVSDDTTAINAAVTTCNAAGGGIVYVPPGVYMVNPDYNAGGSVRLRSNVTLFISPNAILKAIGINNEVSAVIRTITNTGVQNVRVTGGGVVLGERLTHTGVGGEHGMGIDFRGVANGVIDNLRVLNCWGDGIYIGGEHSNEGTNILIDKVICDNNRRNGCSIVVGKHVTVSNSFFTNTNGTSPQYGLDVEPDPDPSVSGLVDQVLLANNHFYGNVGGGLVLSGPTVNPNPPTNVVVDGAGIDNVSGNALWLNTANVWCTGVTVKGNILVSAYATGAFLEGRQESGYTYTDAIGIDKVLNITGSNMVSGVANLRKMSVTGPDTGITRTDGALFVGYAFGTETDSTQYGAIVVPTVNTHAVSAIALYARPILKNSAFTCTNAYSAYLDTLAVVGGGVLPTITNAYGLFITDVTKGGTTNTAIKTGLGLVSFGDNLQTDGNFTLTTVGKGIKIKEGSNAKMGTGTLNGATEVTISTTAVTANSRIFLTIQTPHGTPAWALGVSSRSAGVSFGVKGIALDTSDFAWMIVEPS